jgi:glycosyltransferase involved in cell wall biosynthesis
VVLPVLNGAAFLAESIESILAQSFDDLELVVVDDGSTDGSLRVIEHYRRLDRRVVCMTLPRDLRTESGARASNVALASARGSYIARMDADDIAPPDRIEHQLDELLGRNLDVIGGQVMMFGDRSGERWYPTSHQGIARELLFRSGLTNPSMMARAEVLRSARFSEAEAYEEYELQTRLVGQVRFGNSGQIVLRQRAHPGQTTRVLNERKLQSRQRLKFGYFFKSFPTASLRDFRCVNALGNGEPFAARDDLVLAGDWLVRLSRLPEARLRERMARRWTDACEAYLGAPGDVATLCEPLAARILAST